MLVLVVDTPFLQQLRVRRILIFHPCFQPASQSAVAFVPGPPSGPIATWPRVYMYNGRKVTPTSALYSLQMSQQDGRGRGAAGMRVLCTDFPHQGGPCLIFNETSHRERQKLNL